MCTAHTHNVQGGGGRVVGEQLSGSYIEAREEGRKDEVKMRERERDAASPGEQLSLPADYIAPLSLTLTY